jgi:SAM-dependent methyltransferase
MRIDDDGIRIAEDLQDRLELDIGGRRIWAFDPQRDGDAHGEGDRLVPWPVRLRPHLNGRGEVLVRSLDSSEVLFRDTVTLGHGEGDLAVVDGDGNPLVVAKNNRMSRAMFEHANDSERRHVVETIVEALEFLGHRGHDAFLAFGNLLGAVRDGRLIGHDNDADIAYIAASSHPVDIMLESMRIEREYQEAGWETFRGTGAAFKVFSHLPDGRRIGIDVFSGFFFDGLFHIAGFVAAPLSRDVLVPTSTVKLEGCEVPAPADPETLLEATYGSGWRVPDPSFKYETPRWLRRRFRGLFRGERLHGGYWDDFYATKAEKVPEEPSSFAQWVLEREPRPTSLLDIGSGTGRDSLWLASKGVTVLGCDYSHFGVNYARRRAREKDVTAKFRVLDLYDLRQMLTAGALLARNRKVDAVYARFLVHALEDTGRQNLWRFARSVLSSTKGRIYLEFRTEPTEHKFGEHYRHFVQPELVRSELESYGFGIEHCENRHGLAVYGSEDPRVCRIIARLEG